MKEGAWCEKGEKWASAEAVARMNGEGSDEGAERSSIETTPSVEPAMSWVTVVSVEKLLLVSPSVEAPKERRCQQKLAEIGATE